MAQGERRHIPEPSLARLHRYLLILRRLRRQGVEVVSSEELGREAGTASALVRKDFSYLDCAGQRGVGYEVDRLVVTLEGLLGPAEPRALIVVGAGNLGGALAGYAGFELQGYRVVGLFDNNPARVGHHLQGLVVRHVKELPEFVASTGASLAVLAVPAARAQEAADLCVQAGVRGLLNFAPTQVKTPPQVRVRQVDLSEELQILNYQLSREAEEPSGSEG